MSSGFQKALDRITGNEKRSAVEAEAVRRSNAVCQAEFGPCWFQWGFAGNGLFSKREGTRKAKGTIASPFYEAGYKGAAERLDVTCEKQRGCHQEGEVPSPLVSNFLDEVRSWQGKVTPAPGSVPPWSPPPKAGPSTGTGTLILVLGGAGLAAWLLL